jgi:hypothetical protein
MLPWTQEGRVDTVEEAVGKLLRVERAGEGMSGRGGRELRG